MRSAFMRHQFDLVQTDTHVKVPLTRVAEGVFRALILAGIIGFGWFMIKDRLVPETKREVSRDELIQSFGLEDEEAFQEVMKNVEVQDLQEALNELAIDPNATIEQQKLLYKNYIAAAQRIGKSRMLRRKIDGLNRELKYRTQLAFLNLKNGIKDPEANSALMELSKLYKSIQFEEDSESLNDQAKLSEIVATMVTFVDTGSDEKEDAKIDEVSSSIETFGNLLKNSQLGKTLLQLIQLSRNQLYELDRSTKIADEIELLLDEVHNGNKIERISKIANMDCSTFSASELDYLSDENSFVDSYVKKFRSALTRLLEVDDLDMEVYEIVLGKLEQMASAGWNRAAIQMLADTNNAFNLSEVDQAIANRAKLFEIRLAKTGKQFSIEGMKDLTKGSAKFKSPTAYINVLLFIGFENKQQSDHRLNQILQLFRRMDIKISQLNFSVILVHDNDKMNGKPGLEKLAEQLPVLNWWQLNINSPGYAKYEDIVSLDSTPFAIVLDGSNRVVSIDPSLSELQTLFTKLEDSGSAKTN